MILLATATAFFVLGLTGTVGKLLFDDWRVRQAMRVIVRVPDAPTEPPIG